MPAHNLSQTIDAAPLGAMLKDRFITVLQLPGFGGLRIGFDQPDSIALAVLVIRGIHPCSDLFKYGSAVNQSGIMPVLAHMTLTARF